MKINACFLVFFVWLNGGIVMSAFASDQKTGYEDLSYERLSLKELRAQIVDIAARIHDLEVEASNIESYLVDSSLQLAKKEELVKNHKYQSSLALQGLVHLSRMPPVTRLFLDKDPNQNIQVGLLLQSIVTALKQETDMICNQVNELNHLKKEIYLQKNSLNHIHAELTSKQSFLSRLLHTKSHLHGKQAKIEFDHKLVSSKSMQELLEEVKEPAQRMKEVGHPKGLYLIPPVSGKILTMFDHKKELTPYGRGVVIEARQKAYVMSPAQGMVVFAGPFKGYGNMIIIQAADDYHILLAGMGKLLINAGQDVSSGEPVGYMNARGKQKLYLELRKNTAIVDPTPWVIKWKQ